jgi:putative ABC transport system permease protein
VSASRAALVVRVGLRYLGSRRLATGVSIGAVGAAVLLVVAVALTSFAVKRTAVEGSLRYPLVVGPAGASSIQLIFSTLFHIDKPTGTIPAGVWEELLADPRVVAAYPVALADSLEAYPIVGTDPAFLRDLRVGAAAGTLELARVGDAVLGSEAADRTGLAIGDTFHGSHGMIGSEGAHVHDEVIYRVTGVLAPTGGPEDAAAYTTYQTVWAVHGGADHEADHEAGHGHHGEKDRFHLGEGRLTAVLVRTSNPVQTGMLEREISLRPGLQAVDTGRAIRRIVAYMDKGERLIEVFGAVTVAIAAAMILVTLVMSINERRRELALLRSLGVGRATLSLIVMVEALVTTLAGALLGALGGHVAVWWAAAPIQGALGVAVEPWVVTSLELFAVAFALAAGQVLALLGMLWTYRMNLVTEIARD